MLKLMTLNLWGYHAWDNAADRWEVRIQNILSLINDQQPDCIALQEVLTNHAYSDWPQSDLIADQCGYTYRTFAPTFVRNKSRDREGNRTQRAPHGQALLSKFPILSSENYFLRYYPEHPEESSTLLCSIDSPEGVLDICDVHFANSDVAYKHLDHLLELVDSRSVEPIILGDFNIYKLAQYKAKQPLLKPYTLSSELAEYTSYPADRDSLDYIIAPSDKYTLSNIVCPDVFVSDHRALLADVRFN